MQPLLCYKRVITSWYERLERIAHATNYKDTKMEDSAFVGTKLKYAVDITAYGFDMVENDFRIDLKNGKKTIHFNKEDLSVDDNNIYYLCFDSAALGEGLVTAIVTAMVPDPDFPDGVRDEVFSFVLIYLKNPKGVWAASM